MCFSKTLTAQLLKMKYKNISADESKNNIVVSTLEVYER